MKYLEKVSDGGENAKRAAFVEFYKQFGTHYLREAKFGGKLIVETKLNREDTASSELKKQEQCNSLNVGFSTPMLQAGHTEKRCSNSLVNDNSGGSSQKSSARVVAIGSRPYKDSQGINL